jgi:hypothetical protein
MKQGQACEMEKDFNSKAPPSGTKEFEEALADRFGKKTAARVLQAFGTIGLPVPQDETQFLRGTDGLLVFVNRYGLVVRVEKTKPDRGVRVDNPWVVPAFATLPLGRATIEICPGGEFEEQDFSWHISRRLNPDKLEMWDQGVRNLTRVTAWKTPHFPEGVSLVADRMAVGKLTRGAGFVRALLEKSGLAQSTLPKKSQKQIEEEAEILSAREKSWGPVMRLFDGAVKGENRWEQAWAACADLVERGQLLIGWNKGSIMTNFKTDYAKRVAAAYETAFPPAPAKPGPGPQARQP